MDRNLVPASLHAIIPIVEDWGSLSQDEQDIKLRRLLRQDAVGAAALRTQVEPHRATIRDWPAILFAGKTHKSQYTDADWAHPYWLFLSTLKVLESIPWTGNDDDPDVIAANERYRREREDHRIRRARAQAAELFSQKAYAKAADAYRSIENALTPAEQKKLTYCERQLQP